MALEREAFAKVDHYSTHYKLSLDFLGEIWPRSLKVIQTLLGANHEPGSSTYLEVAEDRQQSILVDDRQNFMLPKNIDNTEKPGARRILF